MGIVEEAHNVRVLGVGDQTVVLGHGFGTDQSVWKHLVPHLVEDYRVILYDNMGAGTTNPEYFDFERYSNIKGFVFDLLAILEELQVTSCIFVGHSFSAMLGIIASVYRPDLFSKLIFLNGTPRLVNGEGYYGGFERQEIDQLFEGMQANYESWCSGFAPLVIGGDMDSVAVQEFCRTLFNMRPDIALVVAHLVFLSDVRDMLPSVTVPCHILQSKKDMAVPVIVAEYLHMHLKSPSVVEVMPVGGHLPQLSSPDLVIPVVVNHIRSAFPVAGQ